MKAHAEIPIALLRLYLGIIRITQTTSTQKENLLICWGQYTYEIMYIRVMMARININTICLPFSLYLRSCLCFCSLAGLFLQAFWTCFSPENHIADILHKVTARKHRVHETGSGGDKYYPVFSAIYPAYDFGSRPVAQITISHFLAHIQPRLNWKTRYLPTRQNVCLVSSVALELYKK